LSRNGGLVVLFARGIPSHSKTSASQLYLDALFNNYFIEADEEEALPPTQRVGRFL
jgi:hypothetical protein